MIKINFFKTNFFNLLISSIVPFLILGPFIPDLILSISSLFFLYYVFRYNKFYFFKNKSLIFFFLFCTILIFCSLLSENILFSLKSSLFYFRIGIFSCFIWFLIEKDKKILKFFYYFILFSFLALVIDGYCQFFLGENILGYKKYGIRISSFFGDEMIMGSYLSRLLPLLFALFLIKEKNKFEIYFIGILFILIDILVFISGERAAFFFINLSSIFIIFFIKQFQVYRLITLIIGIIFIVLITFSHSNSLSKTLSERMFHEPLKSMNFLDSSKKKVIFTRAHDSHIRTAFEMFKESPIYGHGPKMFRVLCSNEKYAIGDAPCSTHPHNFYIQLLAETGVLGFSYLFLMFLYVLYCSFKQLISIIFKRNRYLSDYQVCLLGALIITLWPISPNGNFFTNWLMIVYSLPIGFYLHSIYSKIDKRSNLD